MDFNENAEINEFDELICTFESVLVENLNHKVEYKDDYNNVLLNIAGKSIMTAHEIICLIKNGFPDGALALSRNVYELYITLGFFEHNLCSPIFDNLVHDYYIDREVQGVKAILWHTKVSKQVDKQKELEQQLDRLKSLATRKIGKDYWWSGKTNFAEMQEEVAQIMGNDKSIMLAHLLYKRACISLHASCLGNSIRIGSPKDFVGIDNSAKEKGFGLPLYFTAFSMIPIIGVVCKHFNLEYETLVEMCNSLAMEFYINWEKENV